MFTKILTAVGLRSRCCGAKIETWHAGKDICSECHHWIRKNKSQEAIDSLQPAASKSVLKLKNIK